MCSRTVLGKWCELAFGSVPFSRRGIKPAGDDVVFVMALDLTFVVRGRMRVYRHTPRAPREPVRRTSALLRDPFALAKALQNTCFGTL